MFVKRRLSGQILLVVLTIMFLLALFLQCIAQEVILEYQRIHNQILEYQLWQQLETKARIFIKNLNIPSDVRIGAISSNNQVEIIDFIPDTLDVNCASEIVVYKLAINSDREPVKLLITYSVRK